MRTLIMVLAFLSLGQQDTRVTNVQAQTDVDQNLAAKKLASQEMAEQVKKDRLVAEVKALHTSIVSLSGSQGKSKPKPEQLALLAKLQNLDDDLAQVVIGSKQLDQAYKLVHSRMLGMQAVLSDLKKTGLTTIKSRVASVELQVKQLTVLTA